MRRRAPWLLVALMAAPPASAGEAPPRFGRDVRPILRARCWKCHDTSQHKGGLSLRTPATMLEGGDSGPALVARKAGESLIVEQLEAGAMPPGEAEKLSAAEIATL